MAQKNITPRPVLLAQYRPPLFVVAKVELQIDLFADHALVAARLELRRNPAAPAEAEAGLALDGEALELLTLRLNGSELPPQRYRLTDRGQLLISDLPSVCTLETTSRIYSAANTALEGIYRSGPMFCTQCEPEGFRRITWYPDRPDVLAPFTVTISADRQQCPVLLAGGNPTGRGEVSDYGAPHLAAIGPAHVPEHASPSRLPQPVAPRDRLPSASPGDQLQGELPAGRHWASFRDPFPKPSYLFALVAGDLAAIHDTFTTASGRQVALAIYTDHHNRDKCDHAMAALKKAMRWDEETFGLEYDLDHYLIVAVDDFNMGAMENKGLNIFNAAYVLARPDTATDDDFERIEAVIAHEYFHNWTGNRVTCRDWFQLSLKEGLTVFRDQLFSQDLHSPGVKRINDVRLLREHQFAEDAGPLAHPVRPDSYFEINNFYTLTVYEKGAELVRMLHTLLGAEKFRAGLTLYLQRHDGTAATVEDFLAAMAAAGGRDLGQFLRWYQHPGTPRLEIKDHFNPTTGCYRLLVRQHQPQPTDQGTQEVSDQAGHEVSGHRTQEVSEHGVPQVAASGKAMRASAREPARSPQDAVPRARLQPLLLPLAVGLLAEDGREVAAELLVVEQEQQEFEFRGLTKPPTPSLLRGFSAPVRLEYAYRPEQLRLLLAHDRDPFCRWEAGQRLSSALLLDLAVSWQAGRELLVPPDFIELYRQLLSAAGALADKSFAALLLALPAEDYLAEQMAVIDVEAIHAARELVRRQLAQALTTEWRELYEASRALAIGGTASGAAAGGEAAGSNPVAGPGPLYDSHRAGCRRLQNLALSFLLALPEEEVWQLAHHQFATATNMSDSLAALRGLVHAASGQGAPQIAAIGPAHVLKHASPSRLPQSAALPDRLLDGESGVRFSPGGLADDRGRISSLSPSALAVEVLAEFARRWQAEPLVMDKWFAVQATAPAAATLEKVQELLRHPAYNPGNPNRVRALIGSLTGANPLAFHRADGAGYRFLTDRILELDPKNPQLAARLTARLSRWQRYNPERQRHQREQLQRLATTPELSRDVRELVEKSLAVL